jgi:hypothetical protein
MPKTNMVKNIFLVAIVLTLLSGCANEEKAWEQARSEDSTSAYERFVKKYPKGQFTDSAIQKIEGRKILIHSIPSKLKVYLAPQDDDKTGLKKIEEGWVPIYNKSQKKHELIDDKNFKGTSPLVLNDMKSGHSIVALEPVEFINSGMSFQNRDPFLKCIALVSSFPMEESEMMNKFRRGEIKQEGAVIYKFEKKKEKKEIVILHVKENITLDELSSEYPKGLNFAFDRLKLDQELGKKNIRFLMTDDELGTVLDLLQRGGKSIFQKGDIRILIEILDDQNFKIETYGKIKKN